MKYMLLIYGPEQGDWGDTPSAALDAEMARWFAVDGEMRTAGVMVAGEALQPTTTATCVRTRDGKDLITDGPFAETKEVLGGFYYLDVPSLDEALEWAKKLPAAEYGTIEVRPVMVFDAPEGTA